MTTVCCFTASGNSLYAARRIGETVLSIPQLMRRDEIVISDDAVGIVCPVYAGEMPVMVREFVSRAKIRTPYFFFIYTYGMMYSAAFAHAKLAAESAGLQLSYINAVKMADNYLPGFDIQKQLDTLPEKNIEGQIEKILADLKERKQTEVPVTFLTKLQMKLIGKFMGERILRREATREYIVSDSCIRCGICAKVCPANNITVTDRVTFSDRCEVCYACIHNCPQHAIRLKKEAGTLRFRNEHVNLKDIISMNE